MADPLHEAALRALARRALSVEELRERLVRKGYDAAAVRREIRRLAHLDLLDDGALARAVAATKTRAGYGRRAVLATLRRRRLPAELAEAAVADVTDEDVRAALHRSLDRAVRRYPRWRSLPDERRKVIRYLLTRGFRAGAVRDALAAVTGDDADAAEPDEQGDTTELP